MHAITVEGVSIFESIMFARHYGLEKSTSPATGLLLLLLLCMCDETCRGPCRPHTVSDPSGIAHGIDLLFFGCQKPLGGRKPAICEATQRQASAMLPSVYNNEDDFV